VTVNMPAEVEDVSFGASAGMIEESTTRMHHIRIPANDRYDWKRHDGILCVDGLGNNKSCVPQYSIKNPTAKKLL